MEELLDILLTNQNISEKDRRKKLKQVIFIMQYIAVPDISGGSTTPHFLPVHTYNNPTQGRV